MGGTVWQGGSLPETNARLARGITLDFEHYAHVRRFAGSLSPVLFALNRLYVQERVFGRWPEEAISRFLQIMTFCQLPTSILADAMLAAARVRGN